MAEAAQLAASDREASTQMFEDMQVTLFDDAPSISLYTQTYQRAMLETVRRLRRQPRLRERGLRVRPDTRRGVTRFVLRRLAQAVLVVVGVIVLTFVVARIVPGDPAGSWAGPKASQAELERSGRSWGSTPRSPSRSPRTSAGSCGATGASRCTPASRCWGT